MPAVARSVPVVFWLAPPMRDIARIENALDHHGYHLVALRGAGSLSLPRQITPT